MKKVFVKISFYIVLTALLFTVFAAVFVPSQIAFAAETVEVVKAPVSNLEGNATAGKSTVAVLDNEGRKFYIPESYYLTDIDTLSNPFMQIITVKYANIENEHFFLSEQPITSQITVEKDENLFPDVRLFIKEGAEVVLGTKAINNEYTIKLLGYSEDSTEIYVAATFNGESVYGFITVENLEPFTVPYQQRAQAERDALLAAKEEEKNPFGVGANTSVALRIILIVGIAVPTVLIVLLLFKPSKNERRYSKNTVRNSRSRDDFDYDDSRSYRSRDDRDYPRRDRDYDRDYDSRYDDRYNDRRDYDRYYNDRRDDRYRD